MIILFCRGIGYTFGDWPSTRAIHTAARSSCCPRVDNNRAFGKGVWNNSEIWPMEEGCHLVRQYTAPQLTTGCKKDCLNFKYITKHNPSFSPHQSRHVPHQACPFNYPGLAKNTVPINIGWLSNESTPNPQTYDNPRTPTYCLYWPTFSWRPKHCFGVPSSSKLIPTTPGPRCHRHKCC